MRVWDIVDYLYPGFEITSTERTSQRLRKNAISKATKAMLAFSLVVSTAATSKVVDRKDSISRSSPSQIPGQPVISEVYWATDLESKTAISLVDEHELLEKSIRGIANYRVESDDPTPDDIGPISERFRD